MIQRLFITGMFRSGTTLMARALNAHAQMVVASDPFFEAFKVLRDIFWNAHDPDFKDNGGPIGDYFEEDSTLRKAFLEQFGDLPVDAAALEKIKRRVARACRPYSPRIEPLIEGLEGDHATALVEQMAPLVGKAYPKPDARVVGFKETWLDEFMGPLMAKPFAFRCLHIVRDPRGVIASKKRDPKGNYPLAFMIRHWRKSVALGLHWQDDPRYLRVHYEDLIDNPQGTMEAICRHLEVAFDSRMVDFAHIKDGSGQPWQQNSFFGSSRRFNPDYVKKWREVLTEQERLVIEYCCRPEMKAMEYQPMTPEKGMTPLLTFREPIDEMVPWIRSHGYQWDEDKAAAEIVRRYMLDHPYLDWPQSILERFFISRHAFSRLCR